jgi:hypothetical protein
MKANSRSDKANMGWWWYRGRWPDAGRVAGLFPPQESHWKLDPQVHLTPQAGERVSRESVQVPFDTAAGNVNADWGTHYDGKQMQRWGEHYGHIVADLEEQERRDYFKGQRPQGPANAPELLSIGMDGGRVQERQKDPQNDSRWHEDKVLTISSYHKAPARETGGDPQPQRLVTSYVGTMQAAGKFGQLSRVEAERRGIRQALEVVVIGDGASWIDTIAQEHFACHTRIIDFYHVDERLAAIAQALYPVQEHPRKRLADRLESQLYQGKVATIIRWLEKKARKLGRPRDADAANHPRQVIWENLGYMQKHQAQMDYPAYRARSWPIGSGVTESGVKLFNKRVKGTEQFWNESGAEAILALRALRLSQDDRWRHYWLYGALLRMAA